MLILKYIALIVILLYLSGVTLLFFFQTRLIFYPGKLSKNYKFKKFPLREEVFLKTTDGETINALFFSGKNKGQVILYFHGNAGDLSGWQFAAEDLLPSGLCVFMIDYRGYGKSSGSISEKGFYCDADAAYQFLITEKKIKPDSIVIYGRSIGSGVAVDLAARKKSAGLILESSYSSFSKLANEKVPFFFPSLYLRSKFDNLQKINSVKAPVLIVHGTDDTLIPAVHASELYNRFKGKKELILIDKGQHNDLHSFSEYKDLITNIVPEFFFQTQRYRLSEN
jgi:fermentation-respiration switch protein FrsA (DUF1100 family)